MVGPKERWLLDLGLPIEEGDFDDASPDHVGCIVARPIGDKHVKFRIVVRPGLDEQARETLAEWAEGLVVRFQDGGIVADGWFPTSWGGYQLWARPVWLPEV